MVASAVLDPTKPGKIVCCDPKIIMVYATCSKRGNPTRVDFTAPRTLLTHVMKQAMRQAPTCQALHYVTRLPVLLPTRYV